MDITLALGGGGAKGNSHIGVIRRLEKEGFRVRGVAGTSFGGLVAVLYALGYSPDKIEETFASLDQTQFYGHAPDDGPSLMGLAGVTRLLEETIGDATFADLKLPCVLTAVDLKSGKEVLLSKGRLVDAMLATIAMPGIFPAALYRWARAGGWRHTGSRPGGARSNACAAPTGGRGGVDHAHGHSPSVLASPISEILGWAHSFPCIKSDAIRFGLGYLLTLP